MSLSGFGSDWTISGINSDITLGDEGKGLLTVSGGAVVTVPDDGVIAAQSTSSGRLVVSGLGSLADIGDDLIVGSQGAAVIEILSAGQLECDVILLGDLNTGSGEVLVSGDLSQLNSTLSNVGDAGRGTVQISNGGQWQVAGDLNIGILAGSSGRLEVSGQGSRVALGGPNNNVGSAGHGSVVVRDGATLNAAASLTLAGTATSTGELDVSGAGALLDVFGGFSTGAGQALLTVAEGGRVRTTTSSSLSSTTRLRLVNGVWESSAASAAALNVFGVLEGTGTIRAQGITLAAGTTPSTLKVAFNDEMSLTGALTCNGLVDVQQGELTVGGALANSGKVNVNAGTLWIGSPATNAVSTGLISARDAILWFDEGLDNLGTITAAAGISEVNGDIQNRASGRIAVSGGATALFYGDVTNAGTISVTAAGNLASTAVFFGAYSGNGVSGTGNVFIEGDAQPGFSPGTMTFGGNLSLGSLAALRVELGGIIAGTQYDRLVVAGDLTLGGGLEVSLINGFIPAAGMSFNLWTAGTHSGGFTSIALPPLPAGLFWRTEKIDTAGVISVNPVPGSYAAFAAFYALTTPPGGDEDGDGFPNALEYGLGLDPVLPNARGEPGVPDFRKNGANDIYYFAMPELPAPDLELEIQSSTNLVNWSVLATRTGGNPWTGALLPTLDVPADGMQTVTLTRPDGGAPRRFYRLAARLLP